MTKEEYRLIGNIAKRAHELIGITQSDIFMDVCATIEGGTSMDLEKLANFDDENFAHDIMGIHLTLNHTTKQLEDNFLPRCSK